MLTVDEMNDGDYVRLVKGPDRERVGIVCELATTERGERVAGIISAGMGMNWYYQGDFVRLSADEKLLTDQDRADLDEIADARTA